MTLDLAKLRAETLALLDGTTPGPWSVFINDAGDEWTGWPLSVSADDIVDKTIIRPGGHWPYEWDAKTSQYEACQNARLIAASPTLAADTLRLLDDNLRLTAENERLRAERDEQRERAEEAESEITRAQEQVSAEFEGDCWKAIHNLLERTGFDWSEYSEDGVTASEAQRWIVEELDRLEAERDAAWQAGAEAMREAAAAAFGHDITGKLLASSIRALPLPGQPTNNEENT